MSIRFLPAFGVVLVGASTLSAQSRTVAGASPATHSAALLPAVDTSLLHGLHFRMVGPPRGGRVTTVTGVASQPRTFYMGVASGGVFKTTDAGASWIPITDGKVPVGSTGSIAVAESDPNIIYLGTGSDDIRSNVSTGRGVYKSTDAGQTWSFVGLYDAGQIGAVRIHPTNPNVAWVAAIGNAFKPNAERGVFKTTDGGKTWKKVLFVSDSIGAADLELNPANPDIVYAWMWRGERKPWTIISGAQSSTGVGFYKSTDGGEHFAKIAGGLPTELIGKANLAVTAANPNRIYALVEAKPGGGLYRSEDAGQSWKQVSNFAQLITLPFYYVALGADPTNADVVYAGAESFYKSTDGGATWTPLRTPHGDNHDIWINPKDGRIMIQSNDGGGNVSNDGGRTWSSQMNQPTAEIYGVWLDDQYPYRLYGAQQDASTVIVPSAQLPGSTEPFESGPGCETGPIIPHPKNPQVVYGACKGQFGRMFMNTRQEQAYWIGGQSLYGNDAKDLIYRFQRVSPMEVSLFDSSTVYYGSQYLHRSHDGGVHWEKISPDLTAHPACCQGGSGEPITRDVTGEEFYSTLYAISESKLEPGVIWTGANDGPFHISRDNGKTWTNITPKGLPPGGRVQYIETSPHRKGSAYYAVYRYLLGDFEPYIYKTDNYGATWTRLTDGKNGIAMDNPTRVVREDPDREGLLYAGTEFGMYISFDNGAHWQSFDRNMPTVPITDIKRHQKDLVVSTQGRSMWIMDDVTPLSQITAQTVSSAAVLFKPADAIRGRLGGGRGGFGGGRAGGGPAPGQAQFAENGATINYYLGRAPSGPITIDITDAAGKTVRSYSSEAAATAAAEDAPAANADEEGGPAFRRAAPPVRLTTNVGMNRLTWDFNNGGGLMVPPGSYRVKMTAGSWSDAQPLVLKIDPRLSADNITAADLREQYEHNVRMRDMVAEVGKVANRVRQARTRLRSGGNADSLSKVDALATTLFGPDEGVRYGRPGLQTQITYLAGMTARVDQRIGRDAVERYQTLRKELDALEARVTQVLGAQ
ncbi:MAG: WD40/YVTN/BNR-like repeat-containing protein [Deltaproteobacteria bacterium]